MGNIILALMENDSPDKFAEDVANAYFANPDHVRRLLNADCIEECVNYVLDNQRVEFDISDLPLFEDEEPLFAKPSRQKGRRKHDKKAVKRKGSTKRFRDRSRKCASEGHMYKVYDCGMLDRRGRALAKTGEVAFKVSHRLTRKVEKVDNENKTPQYQYTEKIDYDDGSISITMCRDAWIEGWETDSEPLEEWYQAGLRRDAELSRREAKLSSNTNPDDSNIDAKCTQEQNAQEQDTAEFSAVELASIATRIANADPVQRARIRSFMQTV